MDNRAIGIFDSGLGGLTVAGELSRMLPSEDIIYFGDTGRVPYGTKSKETICRYVRQDENFLLSRNVKAIIVACGTASSAAKSVTEKLPVPFVDVVSPTAKDAAAATKNGKIGVIGTSATIKSGAFKNALLEINPDFEIYDIACPVFVPLVEAGWISENDGITVLTAERYLAPLRENGIDTLILGCTHFPIISEIIQKVMGENVTLISSGKSAAKEAVKMLEKNGLLSDKNAGKQEFFVSDDIKSFTQTADMFLGSKIDDSVFKIDIEKF